MTTQTPYQPSLDPLLDRAKAMAEYLRKKKDNRLTLWRMEAPQATSTRFRKLLLTQLTGTHQRMNETDVDYMLRMQDTLTDQGWEIKEIGSNQHAQRQQMRKLRNELDRAATRGNHDRDLRVASNDAVDTKTAA
jgi:hypothetical protein